MCFHLLLEREWCFIEPFFGMRDRETSTICCNMCAKVRLSTASDLHWLDIHRTVFTVNHQLLDNSLSQVVFQLVGDADHDEHVAPIDVRKMSQALKHFCRPFRLYPTKASLYGVTGLSLLQMQRTFSPLIQARFKGSKDIQRSSFWDPRIQNQQSISINETG